MARPLRILLPNTPHHIMQRGHKRQTVFVADEDYRYYLDNLSFFKKEFGCKVYAYCLMTNHVHLAVDPGNEPESLSQLMRRVSGRQTCYVNKIEGRSGSLWEGRFKSSVVSTVDYLPACCRNIELNLIRAGMVASPGQYRWSSYRSKAEGKKDPFVDYDTCYLALSRSRKERQAAYAEFVADTIAEGETKLIRNALQRGQLTGGEHFRAEISSRLDIRISNKGPGMAKKTENKADPFSVIRINTPLQKASYSHKIKHEIKGKKEVFHDHKHNGRYSFNHRP